MKEIRPKFVQSIDIHSKTQKKMAGAPPCISYFWGCLSAGRVGNKFGAQTAGRHGGGYGRGNWIIPASADRTDGSKLRF